MMVLRHTSAHHLVLNLSICDPSLYLDYSWKVHDDLCGSDHFPIEIHCNFASHCQTNSSWKLCKADWNTVSDKYNSKLTTELICDSDDPVSNFTNTLIGIANDTIPKSKSRCVKYNTIWYNDECKNARKERKKALKSREKTANLRQPGEIQNHLC